MQNSAPGSGRLRVFGEEEIAETFLRAWDRHRHTMIPARAVSASVYEVAWKPTVTSLYRINLVSCQRACNQSFSVAPVASLVYAETLTPVPSLTHAYGERAKVRRGDTRARETTERLIRLGVWLRRLFLLVARDAHERRVPLHAPWNVGFLRHFRELFRKIILFKSSQAFRRLDCSWGFVEFCL